MIGAKLKVARSATGLSLRGLEEEIGNRVTAQAIGKYERGESMPSSGVLIALADALDVPVDYLARILREKEPSGSMIGYNSVS